MLHKAVAAENLNRLVQIVAELLYQGWVVAG